MMRYPISALACVLTVTESSILGGIQGVFYTCLLCVLKPSSRFPRAQSDVFFKITFFFCPTNSQKTKASSLININDEEKLPVLTFKKLERLNV